jgi:hypothetical protein
VLSVGGRLCTVRVEGPGDPKGTNAPPPGRTLDAGRKCRKIKFEGVSRQIQISLSVLSHVKSIGLVKSTESGPRSSVSGSRAFGASAPMPGE